MKNKHWKSSDDLKLTQLIDQGVSMGEICRVLDRTDKSIYSRRSFLKRNPVQLKERSESPAKVIPTALTDEPSQLINLTAYIERLEEKLKALKLARKILQEDIYEL